MNNRYLLSVWNLFFLAISYLWCFIIVERNKILYIPTRESLGSTKIIYLTLRCVWVSKHNTKDSLWFCRTIQICISNRRLMGAPWLMNTTLHKGQFCADHNVKNSWSNKSVHYENFGTRWRYGISFRYVFYITSEEHVFYVIITRFP